MGPKSSEPTESDLAGRLLESLPVAVLVADAQWRFTYVSPEAARLLERSPAQLIGVEATTAFPEIVASPTLAQAKTVQERGSPLDIDVEWKSRGRVLRIEVIPWEEGLACVLHDVTELRETERQLRASEERYRTLLEVAQEGVWVVDRNGGTTYVNDRMAEMLGYAPEEIAGRSFMDFIEPERRSRARGMFERHRRGERTRMEARMIRNDSTPLHCIVSVQPLADGAGRFQGALALVSDISDRVATEEALRASEQRYRALADTAPLPVMVHQDERLVYANRATLALVGATLSEQLEGESPYRLVHPDDRELARRQAERAARKRPEAGPPVELRVVRLDGEVRHVESLHAPVEWEGRPSSQLVWVDITERKRALDAAKAGEERYRRLVDVSPVPVAVHREGRVLYGNRAALSLFGVKRMAQVVGTPILDFVHPDDHALVRERTRQALGARRALPTAIVRGIRADGRPIEIAATMVPLLWEGEMALQTIMRDVTEQRRAVRALRARERDFRNLAERSPVLMVVHREGRVVYANPIAARMAGVPDSSEIVGADILDYIHPDYHELVLERRRRRKSGEEQLPPAEMKLISRDGRTADVEVASIPTTFEGEPAVQLIIRDITAEKATEEFQRDLMALVAHELRSPLSAMVGFASLLGRDDVSADRDTREALVEKIRARADDMTKLVDELMEAARVGSDEFALDVSHCDVRELLGEVIHEAAVPEEVKVRVRVASDTPKLPCDHERLKHVFANLLANAIKYSPDDGTVRISVKPTDDSIRFRVSDEGPGIPPEDMGQLFERFSKTTRKPQRGRKGFGMGLYISKRIVEAHGGSIEAESRAGKGAVFTVHLPR